MWVSIRWLKCKWMNDADDVVGCIGRKMVLVAVGARCASVLVSIWLGNYDANTKFKSQFFARLVTMKIGRKIFFNSPLASTLHQIECAMNLPQLPRITIDGIRNYKITDHFDVQRICRETAKFQFRYSIANFELCGASTPNIFLYLIKSILWIQKQRVNGLIFARIEPKTNDNNSNKT